MVDGVEKIETTWTCLHVDGKPEQPADPTAAWSCANFKKRVVDAEDPVELCLGTYQNLHHKS